MRKSIFLLLVFAAAFLLKNEAIAANVVHGVEVVVIDAGHGGKFPGAHYGNTHEKELTLKVALKLGKLIENGMPGVKVVYTRKTDKELGKDLATDLQARADIANKAGGDLFISIHANALKVTTVRGAETLIMGESTKEQRYNEGALYENNREDLIDMSDERTAAIVRAYIQNLQFTYGEYSVALARCIQNNYQKAGRRVRGIKPQLLRVLYATDMPGVLTEIGFMSNTQEMAYMTSEKGQNEIARSIFEGVKDYSAYVLETRKVEEGGESAGTQVNKPQVSPVETTQSQVSSNTTTPAEPKRSAAQSATTKPGTPERKSASKKNDGKVIELKTAPPKHSDQPLRFSVQVMASASKVPTSSTRFLGYRNKVKQYIGEGRFCYKYCVGEFKSYSAAKKQLPEIRKVFPDAFVVSVQGTKIVK